VPPTQARPARSSTGWAAGAHVPAAQLSSLPLDEWQYMGSNEYVRAQLPQRRQVIAAAAYLPW